MPLLDEVKAKASGMAHNADQLHPDNAPVGEVEWTRGIFSCGGAGPFLAACCCTPCYYGRVSHRLANFPKSPDETGFSYLNADCCIFYLFGCVALQCVPTYFKRMEQRKKFNLTGTGVKDIFFSACCIPCSLTQETVDLKARAEAQPLVADHEQAYVKQETGMEYKPAASAAPVTQAAPTAPVTQ